MSLRPLPPTHWGKPHVLLYKLGLFTCRRHSRHAPDRPAPRTQARARKLLVGNVDETTLLEAGIGLRAANWARQKKLGVTVIPSNDFSLYDQVLDTAVMVGAIPDAYGWKGGAVPLETYFAMARGADGDAHGDTCGHAHHAHGVPALEMTKWFDTNYHYMVPELDNGSTLRSRSRKPIEEYERRRRSVIPTRPVLVGPVTFLKLGKSEEPALDPLSLLDRLLPVYIEILRELAKRGADWVQIDEPCLVLDLDADRAQALHQAYDGIAKQFRNLRSCWRPTSAPRRQPGDRLCASGRRACISTSCVRPNSSMTSRRSARRTA